MFIYFPDLLFCNNNFFMSNENMFPNCFYIKKYLLRNVLDGLKIPWIAVVRQQFDCTILVAVESFVYSGVHN